MSDDDDFDEPLFDSDDDDGEQGPPVNTLCVGPTAASSDALTVRARKICQDADYKFSTMVIFEEEEGVFSNSRQFAQAMGLNTLPTMQEAGEWLLQKRAAIERAAQAAP